MVDEYVFEFSGGELCLDFANTAGYRFGDEPHEHLHGYPDLVAWGRQAGILREDQAARLSELAAREPRAAAEVHERAVALREAIFRAMNRRTVSLPASAEDLAIISAELRRAGSQVRLQPADGGYSEDWLEVDALDRMIWPVARSAANLLTSDTLDDVRECAADDCNWLFVDTSKNHSRRWCDMKSCGNRAKARRHYDKKKAPESPARAWR